MGHMSYRHFAVYNVVGTLLRAICSYGAGKPKTADCRDYCSVGFAGVISMIRNKCAAAKIGEITPRA